MKITHTAEDEVHIEQDDVRYVVRISRADEALVSIEKFRIPDPRGVNMDDHGVQLGEEEPEDEPFSDILIDPQVGVLIGQFFSAMSLSAHAENTDDERGGA